jgi:hypothetical protein
MSGGNALLEGAEPLFFAPEEQNIYRTPITQIFRSVGAICKLAPSNIALLWSAQALQDNQAINMLLLRSIGNGDRA